MAGRYDVYLGRIALPTLTDEFAENVGRALDTVGEAVIPGAPVPITASLTLPIHGDEGEDQPWLVGDRLRRQLRSLLNNPLAVQQLYLRSTVDPQLDCFIATGGGQISYNPGGPSIGEYVLQLGECFRLGTLSSHRMAKEVRMFDRTDPVTPRDYRKTYFSNLGASTQPRHFFPVGATDLTTENRVLGTGTVNSINGTMPYMDYLSNGEGVSFEIDPGDILKGDVVIWDRKGFTSPAYTLAGDRDPQGASGYGWEEVYGRDYVLTAGDCPVMANGRVRVRYTSGGNFVLESSGGSLYGTPGTVTTGFPVLSRARVVSWTPDEGVLICDLTDTGLKGVLYITLRRGWAGPLFELYGFDTSGFFSPSGLSGAGATDSGPNWSALMQYTTDPQYLADCRLYPALVQR